MCFFVQDKDLVVAILSYYDFTGFDALQALRLLLLKFPFLPMDAGAASRIVSAFGRVYTMQQECHAGHSTLTSGTLFNSR